MKHLKTLSLALLGIILAAASAFAQETGACPAGQFVNGVGNNIISQACSLLAPTHLLSAPTTAPALTSCGTTPSIVGTDFAGTVTMGTTATGCVITFASAYAAAPHCTVTWRATPLASQSYTISTTAITTTQTSASNNLLDYICVALPGG